MKSLEKEKLKEKENLKENLKKEILGVGASFEDLPASRIFLTIQEALDAAAQMQDIRCIIKIAPGTYREHLSITRSDIEITGMGNSPGDTVITGNLSGREILEDGLKRGTFRTQTVFLHAKDVRISNLTIENTAGPGQLAGQAIALYADGDRLVFDRVWLRGQQDTLFVGPLPEKEIEPGGFRGPLEFAPRIWGRQYYTHCRIEGNIDFIFGGGTAFFEECEIFCRNPMPLLDSAQNTGLRVENGEPQHCLSEETSQKGSHGTGMDAKHPLAYITAASTPKGQAYGFVFSKCSLTSDCPPQSCFLGRPWRDYARTVFLECEIGPHICENGWDDWGKELARREAFFAEYACTGPGAGEYGQVQNGQIKKQDKRAGFAHVLSALEAAAYTKEKVLAGEGEAFWTDK